MSLVKMGLEAQEQDLEADALAAQGEIPEDADNIAESPFSPMASRAFSTAVDDSNTLERMNDTLDGAEIEDIPESSRLVMETAMEAIKHRLIGGSVKRSPALESFKTSASLKVAIEENRGVLKRVWDAIVKFFKSIYDWFAGFFGKKKEEAKEIEEIEKKLEVAIKEIETIKLDNKEDAKTKLASVKSKTKLKGVRVKLKDGTAIGQIAQEDFNSSPDDRMRIAEAVRTGKEPIVLVTSRYCPIFGSENIEVKDMFDYGRQVDTKIGAFSNLRINARFLDLASGIDQKSLERIPEGTVEDLVEAVYKGDGITINAVKINVSGNNSSVEKPESKEIDITVSSGLISANMRKISLNYNGSIIKLADDSKNDFYKILNNIDKLNKSALDDDNEEMQQLVKKLKEKMPLINGVMKVSTLVFHYGLQANKLLLDLAESYIAAVALVCEQSLKSVDE